MLEGDADAAARGVFDGLFGLVVEEVVPQAATGRSHGGEVGIWEHARSAHSAGGRGARGQRRVDENAEGVQEAGRKACSPVDASRNVQGREGVFANVSTGADRKANTSRRRRT